MRISVQDGIFLRATDHRSPQPADVWFIHGFGESGLCFREAFDSKLAAAFNLFVPDLPGHGVTPPDPRAMTMDGIAGVLVDLIHSVSGRMQPVVVVGHSLGGILGTRVAERLGKQILIYFNVEGNLTNEDAYFTGMTRGHANPQAFYGAFCSYIFSQMEARGTLQRYFASLRFADTATLFDSGRSCADASRVEESGDEFRRLSCRKTYYWSRAGTADVTREFVEQNEIPNRCFEGDDPWLMTEFGDWFYDALLQDLTPLAPMVRRRVEAATPASTSSIRCSSSGAVSREAVPEPN